jgi:hypothetical protein
VCIFLSMGAALCFSHVAFQRYMIQFSVANRSQ